MKKLKTIATNLNLYNTKYIVLKNTTTELKSKNNEFFKSIYYYPKIKYLLILFAYFTISLSANAQSKSNIIKLETVLKTASNINDFKNLIDGDAVSAICSLLEGGAVCELLSVTKLNEGEEEAMGKIRDKYEFDKFLVEKGINPDDFYRELWLKKNSETIQDRFDFLKQ